MRIYLDDCRKAPDTDKYDYTIWSYNSFRDFVDAYGCPNFISFDHDLGNSPMDCGSGLDCAKYLVEKDLNMNGNFIPQDFDFVVHSANPVGAKNIESYLRQYLDKRDDDV